MNLKLIHLDLLEFKFLQAPKNGEEKRDVWSSKWQFLMVCIANSVGLGNIWRFPFIAYENGGGAFLIPYVIVLILVGTFLVKEFYINFMFTIIFRKTNVLFRNGHWSILQSKLHKNVQRLSIVQRCACAMKSFKFEFLQN